MANDFYNHDNGYPAFNAQGASAAMRAELDKIGAAFDKFPTLLGNGGKIIAVNVSATGLQYLSTTGTGNVVLSTDPTFTLTDVTTNNVSTAQHGWTPKLSGNAATFLNGAGTYTTPPAIPLPSGVLAVTDNVTLTNVNIGYQAVAMTTFGKSVTMPDATTLSVGPVKNVVDNSLGTYPCGIRDNAGTLITGISAGGVVEMSLRDNSTAAGVWSFTGNGTEPGLILVDSSFSSTYSSTYATPFIAFDANKSLHFAFLAAGGFAAFAVDKATGTVGTPVTVSATASMQPRAAFMITATTAMVFYSSTSSTLIGVVISLSSVTTLTVNTPSSTLSAANVGSEDSFRVPKIAQLDTNLFLLSYATATGAGTTSVAAWQVSGGVNANLGTPANIIAANNVLDSTTTRALTTTTGIVNYKSGVAAPYANSAVVISVTNANPPVCTVNTPAALTGVGSSLTAAASSCLLSSTKLLIEDDNNTTGSIIVSVFTISAGVTVTAGTLVSVETAAGVSSSYTSDSAYRYNAHLMPLTASTALLWYKDNASISRTVVLTEAAGVVTAGSIFYRGISANTTTSDQGGTMLPTGVTSFITIKQEGDAAGRFRFRVNAHKISSTTITHGSSHYINALSPSNSQNATQIVGTRLTNGDYALIGVIDGIPIIRTNGDYINSRGVIKTPALAMVAPIQTILSGNRLRVLHTTTFSGSGFAGVDQLRYIEMEIAA